jgi:hypothetical protein
MGLGNWRAVSKVLSHRGLNLMALACLVGSAVALVLYFADPRELLGVPLWEKPLKFLISGALYSATFSWLYSFVDKGKKFAHLMGNLIVILLVVEIVVIAGLGASGTTSHFNVSTPFHIAIWSVMAAAITGVWVSTFLLGATLWNAPRMASELRLAVRWALGLGLAGMGIAFTMTPPQPQQVLPENWQGIAGAHTVGAADGGPGIPFLGWSSVSGDLRVSHFFGLHALQVLPLLALVLSALIVSYAARVAILQGFAVGYGMLIVITYVQALSGESITNPSTLTLAATATMIAISLLIGGWTFIRVKKSEGALAPRT